MLNIETIIKLMVDVASLLSRTYHVNKITDGNDQPWHMTMKFILQQYNLLAIVDGTNVGPNIDGPTNALDVQTWKHSY